MLGLYLAFFVTFDILVLQGRTVKYRRLLTHVHVWPYVDCVGFILGYKGMVYSYLCRVVRCILSIA